MRIALIHTQLRRGGGMESYLLDLVRGFQARGDTVSVWAYGVDAGLAAELGVEAHIVGSIPLPRFARNAAHSHRILSLGLREDHDLVISLARTRGQDVAVTGGTHPGFLEAMQRGAGLSDRIELALERACVESSPMIVAHSRSLAAELERYYSISPERVKVLYPPVDTQRFRRLGPPERQAMRSSLGLADTDIAFLFPSMGHERKGLPNLLRAFARLNEPRAVLLVAGRRRGGLRRPRKDTNRVVYLDYVSAMPALYSAVDCTVLPSRYEPFGLVIAESLQCGTGVIVSSSAGVAELLTPEDGLCVENGDTPGLEAALRRICDAPLVPKPDFVRRNGLERSMHVDALVEIGSDAVARRGLP
jgi:glycosyltransferase involved in cell wall biosynthesis